ncbi:hypothetical protein PAXRUDRAFT_310542 [Paxillus rubicundulus Ve08.2h10]|uniref:Uncharacterized protein n=1 Tax=Paxillus rubicundulus Ve08.2h10 TaxID=930991 RepID=A0A0D0E536_9AGAM|nr:hypothetical protein PAXRUDRAFT_310542 [Paxillus rubicundulus Ve08.2h10]
MAGGVNPEYPHWVITPIYVFIAPTVWRYGASPESGLSVGHVPNRSHTIMNSPKGLRPDPEEAKTRVQGKLTRRTDHS